MFGKSGVVGAPDGGEVVETHGEPRSQANRTKSGENKTTLLFFVPVNE